MIRVHGCTMNLRNTFLLSALGITFLVACGAPQAGPQEPTQGTSDPCYDADIAAKRVWNDETRVQVKAEVMEWGTEIGVNVAQEKAVEITNSMDRLTDDWARMRKAVCKDHFTRQTLSKAEYQQRADCLDRLLMRQRTFLTSLSSPQMDMSEQLTAMTEEMNSCR